MINPYRMEYERQHKKDELPIGVYVLVGVVTAFTILSFMVMVARADVAPTIIYQDDILDEMNRNVTEVGIAPGVNIYVPGASCNETAEESTESTKQHEYSNISISDTEMEELKRIVAAEAQNQSMEGRKAVVEVIFNRVLSSKWPDTVHDVLSQKGQFATWRLRNASWVVPDAAVAPIEYVLENGRTVLPDTSYVYFDTKGVNGKAHIKLGAHFFGRS